MKETEVWDVAVSHTAPSEKQEAEYTVTFKTNRILNGETLEKVLGSLSALIGNVPAECNHQWIDQYDYVSQWKKCLRCGAEKVIT